MAPPRAAAAPPAGLQGDLARGEHDREDDHQGLPQLPGGGADEGHHLVLPRWPIAETPKIHRRNGLLQGDQRRL